MATNSERYFAITERQLVGLINYIMTQPMTEAEPLVNLLRNLPLVSTSEQGENKQDSKAVKPLKVLKDKKTNGTAGDSKS